MKNYFSTSDILVKQYVLLIRNNRYEKEDVPNVYNLKEVVADVLSQNDRMGD